MSRAHRLGAAALLIMTLACSRGGPPRPELRDIPQPDSSGAEPAVQQQIAAARAKLDSLQSDSEAEAGSLASAYADLGFVYLTYEFLEAAEAAFENAARLEPEARRWVYLQGLLAKMRGEAARALVLLERALEMEPGNAVTLVRVADTQLELGSTEQARARFVQALAIDPESAAAIDGLAQVAAATGDDAGAVELFQRALALQPGATRLHYSLSQAYRRLGRMEEAQYHLARRGEAAVVVDDPVLEPIARIGDSVHLRLAQANRAMEDQRYDAAADGYRGVLELDPDHLMARRGLAVALYELGDTQAALEHLEEALRRLPAEGEPARLQRLDILRSLAALHLRSGRDDLAMTALEDLLALDPDRLEARSELADAFARGGRFDRAIAEYDRILTTAPGHAPTLVKRATARLNAGQVEPAIRDFESAVAAAPSDPAVRLRYAEALDRLGRGQAAAAQRAAASATSGEPGEQGGRARFLVEEGRRAAAAGRYEDAIRSFQQAIEVAPDDGTSRLELARLLGHVQRYAEADAEFARVIATSPRSDEAWRGRVLALLLGGELDGAKIALRDALQVFPRDSAMANALARLLATAAPAGVRDPVLALDLARRVHQVRADASSGETLAAALAESGRFPEALALQRPVVDSAPGTPQGDLSRARLEAYERGEPWRLRTTDEIAVLLVASPEPTRAPGGAP